MVIRQPAYAVFTAPKDPRATAATERMLAIGASVAVHAVIAAYLLSWTFHAFRLPPEAPDRTIDGGVVTLEPPKPAQTFKRLDRTVNLTHAPPELTTPPVITTPFTPPHTLDPVRTDTNIAPTGGLVVTDPSLTAHGPKTITDPQWLSKPDADQVSRAFPEEAIRLGKSGMALLSCEVTSAGAVQACSVLSETPRGLGFAKAAISLSHYFRMKPRTEDGEAVSGAIVRIPLRFTLQG